MLEQGTHLAQHLRRICLFGRLQLQPQKIQMGVLLLLQHILLYLADQGIPHSLLLSDHHGQILVEAEQLHLLLALVQHFLPGPVQAGHGRLLPALPHGKLRLDQKVPGRLPVFSLQALGLLAHLAFQKPVLTVSQLIVQPQGQIPAKVLAFLPSLPGALLFPAPGLHRDEKMLPYGLDPDASQIPSAVKIGRIHLAGHPADLVLEILGSKAGSGKLQKLSLRGHTELDIPPAAAPDLQLFL